ncbi:MAG: hypothetical protein KI788_19305, partial [Mameliella sp.]|nr:hypothetical protein [Mameliella sp.]
MVQDGMLDIAVVTRQPNVPGGDVLDREALVWVGAPGFRHDPETALPLSVYPRDICAFRGAMLSALKSAGLRWRIAYTSQSLTGQSAIVGAGLAVTAMTRSMVPEALQVLSTDILPDLPGMEIALHRRPGRPTEPARLLTEMILDRYLRE